MKLGICFVWNAERVEGGWSGSRGAPVQHRICFAWNAESVELSASPSMCGRLERDSERSHGASDLLRVEC